MVTPVLTKKQQKKALSSKNMSLKSIRNILAQPFEKYWPLIDEEDQELITNKLNEYLPAVKRNKVKIAWQERKKLTKEEFTNKKLALVAENVQPTEDVLKTVIFGINAVTRCMEKSNPTCVLLSSTVDPAILTNHICTLASLKSIPLLILSNLEETLKNTVNFKATTIAFKCDNDEDYFKDLCDTILNIAKKFPITNKHRTQSELSLEVTKNEEHNISTNMLYQDDLRSDIKEDEPKVIHLTRLTNKSRAFIPPKSQDTKKINSKDFGDYISINGDNSTSKINENESQVSSMDIDGILGCYIDTQPTFEGKNQKKHNKSYKINSGEKKYIPLRVKRIQGNPTKVKKNKMKQKNKN